MSAARHAKPGYRGNDYAGASRGSGPFAVTFGDPASAIWNEMSRTLAVREGAVLTLAMAEGYEDGTNEGRIVVENGARLTLDGVRIDVSADRGAAALEVRSGRLELTLAEGSDNRLWSGGERAGLENDDNELVIDAVGSQKLGRLSARSYSPFGEADGAGIGGGKGRSGSHITIRGGAIEASSRSDRRGAYGAGIGGGRGGDGEAIVIGGGMVSCRCWASRGMAYGAGIGGGYGGNGVGITILGGVVDARSRGMQGSYGAGVGGGQSNAGFGGGESGSAAGISIRGGRVQASGNVPVGSGLWGSASRNIEIIDGTLIDADSVA